MQTNNKKPDNTNLDVNINTKEHPFGLAWLNSSYLETLLPGTPWQNVSDILSLPLAEVAKQQFNNEHRKQMIVELVGTQFKRSYLTDEIDNPFIILPPSMTLDQRRKLENEAKSWLQIKINETALDKNCAIKTNQTEDTLCHEMKDFLEHTYSVISTSMDRYLYLKQSKIDITSTKKKPQIDPEKDFDAKSVRSLNMLQKYASKNTLREVLKNKRMSAIDEKPKKYHGELSSEYSEVIGDSLLYILRKDPRRIGFVIRKLIGQQLPNNLRQFIWSDILLRNERKKNDTPMDIELAVRKNFAAGVTRGKNELKLKDPTQTPVTSLIENAVIETYSRVIPMQYWLEEHHLRQTMKVLNVLYTYSKDYEPYYIYWLLPFQLTFHDERLKSELIYDLAMYLDLYAKNCFPAWSEVFTISGKIMTDLSTADPQFYDHLRFICKKNTKVNPKDFVNEIIYNEGKKAGNYLVEGADQSAIKASKDLLGDPLIFIRKWIGEGFSGILSPNALLYVWDQLFMSIWSSLDIEVISKALLYLLRSQFMQAKDYDDMRRVFLEEPYKLYTADIQSAFMHLTSGGREDVVAGFNRRNNESLNNGADDSDKFDNYNKYLNSNLNSKKKPTLEPFALKNFKLMLIVPKQGVTADFDPSRLSIGATLYFGDSKLAHKFTEGIALVKDIKSSLQDTKTYDIEVPEMLLFDLSIFEKDIDSSSFKELFVLITIKYKTITYSDLYLGYCKVSIYKPQKIGSISTWDVTQGEVTRLLHPGPQPFDLSNIPDVPKSSYKERLGPTSNIVFNVFNPRTDAFLYKLSKIS